MGKSVILVVVMNVVCSAVAQLSVYNYHQLPSQLQKDSLRNITFSLANFGFVPIGKTFIAEVLESPQFSAQCQPLPSDNNITVNYTKKFMLIPRGECNFVYKAINAQTLGAQAVIIMDNETHNYRIIMADNGYGYRVKIPAIFINEADGKALNYTISSSTTKIILKMEFPNLKSDKADVILYLESNNRFSYKLAASFEKYYNILKDQINLQLVYNVQKCPFSEAQLCGDQDCFFNKQYCALHIFHQKSNSGKLILRQQLTEKIIYEEYNPQGWFKFMKQFEKDCYTVHEYKECSDKTMKNLGIDQAKVNQLVDNTFLNNGQGDNRYLKTDRDLLLNTAISSFPSVSINGILMKGSVTAQFLIDDICNSINSPPKQCRPYIQNYDSLYSTIDWTSIFIVVAAGTLIFSLMFCIYRRFMRRKLKEEMSDKVNDMVSKYIEFYSERNNK